MLQALIAASFMIGAAGFLPELSQAVSNNTTANNNSNSSLRHAWNDCIRVQLLHDSDVLNCSYARDVASLGAHTISGVEYVGMLFSFLTKE